MQIDPQSLAGAVQVGAKLLKIHEDIYAARFYVNNWIVWRLKIDSPEYVVNPALTKCSCPVDGQCKHLKAMRVLLKRSRKPADPRRGR